MKTKKRKHAPSGFTRGVRIGAKVSRRHGRKHAGEPRTKEEAVGKLDTLTTL